MLKIKRPLICLVLLVSVSAIGDNVLVKHNVNLRSDPSSDNPPIAVLHPADEIELIETEQTNAYYHIRTEDGQDGWVWSRNIEIVQTTNPTQPRARSR